MPGDVTMEWPDTWVVRVDLNDYVPVGWEQLHVSSLGIVGVGYLAIPFACTRS